MKGQAWKDLVAVWNEFYSKKKGIPYLYQGKDFTHLKQIVIKITQLHKAQGLTEDDQAIINSFKVFLEHINDNWILENLEIAIINSKFNIIYSKITSQNPTKNLEYYQKTYGVKQ
jgi:hypothetical protein